MCIWIVPGFICECVSTCMYIFCWFALVCLFFGILSMWNTFSQPLQYKLLKNISICRDWRQNRMELKWKKEEWNYTADFKETFLNQTCCQTCHSLNLDVLIMENNYSNCSKRQINVEVTIKTLRPWINHLEVSVFLMTSLSFPVLLVKSKWMNILHLHTKHDCK